VADDALQVYSVGGSVRDELLGLPVSDRDWVVVGATPQAMVALGYRPVGRDFPVFLHPNTQEEYALARTERKAGTGYRGFEVHASPEVTLEQDLARRDLTINAMARAQDGTLVDPHGGRADLEAGVLRHVGVAFAEDPVRILRLARFAARFAAFRVDPATLALCRRMVEAGEADALVAERVWQEIARGLAESRPSRMLEVLEACGALERVLPEVAAAQRPAAGVERPARAGPEGPDDGQPASGLAEAEPTRPRAAAGAMAELGRLLDRAAARAAPLVVRFALLAAARPGGGTAEPAAVQALCARLRVPGDCADLARLLAARYPSPPADEDAAEAALAFVEACDGLRRPDRFGALLLARELLEEVAAGAAAAPASAAGLQAPSARSRRLAAALVAARGGDAGAIARSGGGPAAIASRVRAARLAAVRAALDA
jgi:tRNA nucleotidyltransferase (CCA-adding enzyme)